MKKKIISLLLLVSVAAAVLIFSSSQADAVPYQIDKNITAIMDEIERMAKENPNKASSSNPYKYIAGNADYKNIVKLGSAALPAIDEKIKTSQENGLREYILALAAEEIAKVDLKGDNFGWSNAKQWDKKWHEHLKGIPANFNKILSSNISKDTKVKEVVKLGTPVIPLVMDQIEQGNIDIVPALGDLLKGNEKVTFDPNSIKDYAGWVKDNKINFDDLRTLVEGEQ
jgi:hypothetical protein